MRRIFPQNLALHQRFAHQPELVMFQIAQPAMDQLGGADDVPLARSFISARKTE
jgi:hypothetical protein